MRERGKREKEREGGKQGDKERREKKERKRDWETENRGGEEEEMMHTHLC